MTRSGLASCGSAGSATSCSTSAVIAALASSSSPDRGARIVVDGHAPRQLDDRGGSPVGRRRIARAGRRVAAAELSDRRGGGREQERGRSSLGRTRLVARCRQSDCVLCLIWSLSRRTVGLSTLPVTSGTRRSRRRPGRAAELARAGQGTGGELLALAGAAPAAAAAAAEPGGEDLDRAGRTTPAI